MQVLRSEGILLESGDSRTMLWVQWCISREARRRAKGSSIGHAGPLADSSDARCHERKNLCLMGHSDAVVWKQEEKGRGQPDSGWRCSHEYLRTRADCRILDTRPGVERRRLDLRFVIGFERTHRNCRKNSIERSAVAGAGDIAFSTHGTACDERRPGKFPWPLPVT